MTREDEFIYDGLATNLMFFDLVFPVFKFYIHFYFSDIYFKRVKMCSDNAKS